MQTVKLGKTSTHGFIMSTAPNQDAPITVTTGENPTHSIIWMHGLGADGHDFEPLVPQLIKPDWPAIHFVFPNAPVRPITINGGMPMRGWYDIKGVRLEDKQDQEGVQASVKQINALIDAELTKGVAAERIFLAGFSQGGAIALATALQSTHALAGVIALSTYLPLHEQLLPPAFDAKHTLDVFMAHGTQDTVVPASLGEMSRDALTQHGHHVAWHTYPMAHQLCLPEVQDLQAWLAKRLTV